MNLKIHKQQQKNADLHSPLGWFAYLRKRFVQCFLWENPQKNTISISAAPLATIIRRAASLVLIDATTQESEYFDFETAAQAEQKISEWLAKYQADDDAPLRWWGSTTARTTATDSFYYNLYRYNFYFDLSATTLTLEEYHGEEHSPTAAQLWREYLPSWAWQTAKFSPKAAWRALLTPATFDAQILDYQRVCADNKAYLLPACLPWEQTYEGDIFGYYRAMRQANNHAQYLFFMDTGTQQRMGYQSKDTTPAAEFLPWQQDMAAEEAFYSHAILAPSAASQVGLPRTVANNSANNSANNAANNSTFFALAAGYIFIKNKQIESCALPINQPFYTLQNGNLRSYTRVWIDAQPLTANRKSQLLQSLKAEASQLQNISLSAQNL
jgi:hypothetical protein